MINYISRTIKRVITQIYGQLLRVSDLRHFIMYECRQLPGDEDTSKENCNIIVTSPCKDTKKGRAQLLGLLYLQVSIL